MYVGVDFGLTPAAVLGQKVRGRWFVQSEIVAVDMGIVRFAEVLRQETRNKIFRSFRGYIYMETLLVTLERRQMNQLPSTFLRGAGLRAFPAPSNSVDLRLESVSSQLTKMVEGKPALLIDRSCSQLIKGFEGGYHYKRMEVSGERYADKPDKNMFSHIHDAAQYLLLGAGEGRALMNNQKPLQPVVAQKETLMYLVRKPKKKRQSVWARM